jgi:hypothetical protein
VALQQHPPLPLRIHSADDSTSDIWQKIRDRAGESDPCSIHKSMIPKKSARGRRPLDASECRRRTKRSAVTDTYNNVFTGRPHVARLVMQVSSLLTATDGNIA